MNLCTNHDLTLKYGVENGVSLALFFRTFQSYFGHYRNSWIFSQFGQLGVFASFWAFPRYFGGLEVF